jgi:hypothetical protein
MTPNGHEGRSFCKAVDAISDNPQAAPDRCLTGGAIRGLPSSCGPSIRVARSHEDLGVGRREIADQERLNDSEIIQKGYLIGTGQSTTGVAALSTFFLNFFQ